jgi:hypothetical protein
LWLSPGSLRLWAFAFWSFFSLLFLDCIISINWTSGTLTLLSVDICYRVDPVSSKFFIRLIFYFFTAIFSFEFCFKTVYNYLRALKSKYEQAAQNRTAELEVPPK